MFDLRPAILCKCIEKFLLTFFFIGIFLGLIGCSVYKSQGRGQFESAVPGKLQAQALDVNANKESVRATAVCWIQPANEAPWYSIEKVKAHIKLVSPLIIEICEDTP